MIPLGPYLDDARFADLRARAKTDAIREACALLRGAPGIGDPEALERAVLERERTLSTGIGLGIAVPHAKIPSVREFAIAVGRSEEGIDFDSLDGRPVHLVVLIAGPEGRQAQYLRILASVTLRLRRPEVRRAILEAPGPREALAALR
jgi:mannitol/fructose-specific phosphotransferase system IIA component (Ntr-type)